MLLSKRINRLHASPIREILAIANQAGMISFAGGLPAAETFPVLTGDIPAHVLQYGPSEGDMPLRQRIADDMTAIGLVCTAAQVLVLSGSQQGIDLVAKLFIDEGTPVAVESPTYLAALQVFHLFGARLLPLAALDATTALAYVIPTFQNPTGHCYSETARREFAQRCDNTAVTVFEDDPYRDLAYDPCERKPICAYLERTNWIYQGSFSKSLAPGLRLGFIIASMELIPLLTRAKQAADLHSSRLSQWLVLQQLASIDRPGQIAGLIALYRHKRDCFGALLTTYFADLADWEVPQGGLFFWLTLKRPIDTRELLPHALAQGVAFMPGEYFYAEEQPTIGNLRLNFSHAEEDMMAKGLQRLAIIIRQRHSSVISLASTRSNCNA